MNDKKLGWSSVVSAIVSYLLYFRRVHVGLSMRLSVTVHLQFALRRSCDLWVPSFVHWVIVCWWESLGGLAQDQSPTFWSYCHMKTTGRNQGCQMLVWTQDPSELVLFSGVCCMAQNIQAVNIPTVPSSWKVGDSLQISKSKLNHFASLFTQSADGQHNLKLIYLTRLSPLHVHLPYERPLFGERCIVHDTHLVRRLPLAWATRRQRTHWPTPRHGLYLYLMHTITISMAIVAHDITTKGAIVYTLTYSFTIDCRPSITKHGFTMVLLMLGC